MEMKTPKLNFANQDWRRRSGAAEGALIREMLLK